MTEKTHNVTGVRALPPILTLTLLLAAFLLGWLVPLPVPAAGWLPALGWSLAGAGIILAAGAIGQLMWAHTTVNPHEAATAIVKNGLYGFTRNPIYLANLCLLSGFPLVLDNYWGLILSPLLVLLMNRLVIQYEEAYLEAKFGQEYLDYKSGVRRWL
jgi:protein-S-isoprenylcysteine O-methyltransferase Ste14